MTESKSFPTHVDLMWPTLQALKKLGGSGNNEEIYDKIIEIKKYPESIQNEPHTRGSRTKLEYRGAWAKTYLKNAGALENSSKAVWSITKYGESIAEGEIKNIVKRIRKLSQANTNITEDDFTAEDSSLSKDETTKTGWKDDLLEILKSLDSTDFEKLCQRLLRESGFVKVMVTGKSNDGGIDGTGVLRVNLLSFQVLFQCKRYKDSVGASVVRDFRGAMVGRCDKGLIITTGTFTTAARAEATRDGAPVIDLIDGLELCDLMRSFKMGLETIETVIIKKEWFEQL